MNRTAAKFRPLLLREGFEERTDMNEQYVAITFSKTMDLRDLERVMRRIRWCQQQFKT